MCKVIYNINVNDVRARYRTLSALKMHNGNMDQET